MYLTMKNIFYALTLLLLISACSKKAESNTDIIEEDTTNKPATLPAYRGLYVDGFNTILGDTAKENNLLRWSKKNNFNVLTLYGLNYFLPNSSSYASLASFIKKAKTSYAITEVNATGGATANFTTNVSNYNNSRTNTTERFNWCNLEREFWNNDETFTFSYTVMKQTKMWGATQTPTVKIEEYIGWLKDSATAPVNAARESQIADSIVQVVDRLLIHDYQANISFSYLQPRLSILGQSAAAQGKVLNVAIIFSTEPVFSGPYFTTNNFINAFNIIKNANASATYAGKANINIVGYQLFDYSEGKLVRP
jgi:hypothetical protein